MIAAEVADQGFARCEAPIKQVTALDATVPYSEPMEAYVLPDEDKIVAAVRRCSGWPAPRSGPERHAAARWTRRAQALLRTMWRIRRSRSASARSSAPTRSTG